ncbi:hypothetical protein [Aliikangiella maris]|uniref:Uncharacterized protein n=2 Tax=Aliikangiella maris TaxID=3162458 RepID=A0ABV2C081_9GAMM
MKSRILLFVLMIIFIIVTLVLYKAYLHQSDKPYRNAVSLLKEGKYKDAYVIFKHLSQNGHLHAKIRLAKLYAVGLGVQKDREYASELILCNGTHNCIPGENEYYLGIELIDRHDGLKNGKEALYWIEKSASFSYEPAIKWLKENNQKRN